MKKKITIKISSGLMIGSGNDEFKLGGIDSSTIVDNEGKPYIPASSIKGKLRSLLELSDYNRETIEKYFGVRGAEKDKTQEKSHDEYLNRILFSDLKLKEKTSEQYNDLFEIKYENSIDENKNANPRINKRTISNLEFEGYIIIQKSNDIEEITNIIKKGLELLSSNYIGGHGSRGYGWIEKAELEEVN